jgi:hypothetical protein
MHGKKIGADLDVLPFRDSDRGAFLYIELVG